MGELTSKEMRYIDILVDDLYPETPRPMKEKKRYIKIERNYAGYVILEPSEAGAFIQGELDNQNVGTFTLSEVFLTERQYKNLPEIEE